MTGFTARVFQHFIDQLGGFNMINPSVSRGDVEIVPGTEEFFGEEICEAVSDYSKSIKRIMKGKSWNIRTVDEINGQLSNDKVNWTRDRGETSDENRIMKKEFTKYVNTLYEEFGYYYEDLYQFHEENKKIQNWNVLTNLKNDQDKEIFTSFIVN